jgi:hypothetical protein
MAIFPGILLVPIGLFIHFPVIYLRPTGAIVLYCAVGLVFDATFKSLPFGFTALFCIFFYCLQRSILSKGTTFAAWHRYAFEHTASILHILFLFVLREASFSLYQFLLTALLSQIFLVLAANPMTLAHRKIAFICNHHTKYSL